MKKGKSVTFQLQDVHEKELFSYAESLHNYSGAIKRLMASSEGFNNWRIKQREQVKQLQEQTPGQAQAVRMPGGGVKIKIGG